MSDSTESWNPMCYEVYLSTNSQEDLTFRNSELVLFKRVADPSTDPGLCLLDYPQCWYVGSKSACSCTFRHLHSIELGFEEPVEWYPEEHDELEATRELYATFASLLSSGYHVDLLDRWYGTPPENIMTLDVSLSNVPANAFRLFENHKFRLKR